MSDTQHHFEIEHRGIQPSEVGQPTHVYRPHSNKHRECQFSSLVASDNQRTAILGQIEHSRHICIEIKIEMKSNSKIQNTEMRPASGGTLRGLDSISGPSNENFGVSFGAPQLLLDPLRIESSDRLECAFKRALIVVKKNMSLTMKTGIDESPTYRDICYDGTSGVKRGQVCFYKQHSL